MTITSTTLNHSYFLYRECVLFTFIVNNLYECYINSREANYCLKNRYIPQVLKDLNFQEAEYVEKRLYRVAKKKMQAVKEIYFTSIFKVTFLVYWFDITLWEFSRDHIEWFGYDRENDFWISVLFIVLSLLISNFVNLPFDLYWYFVMEGRYKVNKKSYTRAIFDKFSEISGSLFNNLTFLFLLSASKRTIILTLIGLVNLHLLAILYQTIEPMICSCIHLKIEDDSIEPPLFALAERIGYPLSKISETGVSTEYDRVLGFGKKRILLLKETTIDTLIFSPELEAQTCYLLGHSMRMIKLKNILFECIKIILILLSYFFITSLEDDVYLSYGFHYKSIGLLALLINRFAGAFGRLFNWLRRRANRNSHFEATEFVHTHNYGESLKSAMIKLYKGNMEEIDPEPNYASFYNDEPTILEKIRYLDMLSKKKL